MSRRTICPGNQCPGGPFITSHSGVMSAEHQSPSHPTLAFAVAFLSFHSEQSERTCFPSQPHKPRGPAHGTEWHNRVAHPFASFAKGWGIGQSPTAVFRISTKVDAPFIAQHLARWVGHHKSPNAPAVAVAFLSVILEGDLLGFALCSCSCICSCICSCS